MNAGPSFSVFAYTVAAGDVVEVATLGRFVACLDASAAFEIAISDEPFQAFQKGLTLYMPGGSTFETFQIYNPSGSSITVEIAAGLGDIRDSRLVITAGLVLGAPDTFDGVADVTATASSTTLLAAADASRRELIVSNPSGSAGTVRLGGNGTTGAAQGVPLASGASVVLNTSDAVYAHNPNGSDIDIALATVGV